MSTIIYSLLTVIVIFTIIFGNTLVCIAVATDRRLKAIQNRFLVSLAVADLSVGVLIMPLGLVNQLLGYWVFGSVLCQLWKVFDVLACTASIWNLCLIAVDRYYFITHAVKYSLWRTSNRVNLMIVSIWTLSILISAPPLFWWTADISPNERFKCLISDDVGYILFSTMGSFYVPAVIMLITYSKVWKEARLRARANTTPQGSQRESGNQGQDVPTTKCLLCVQHDGNHKTGHQLIQQKNTSKGLSNDQIESDKCCDQSEPNSSLKKGFECNEKGECQKIRGKTNFPTVDCHSGKPNTFKESNNMPLLEALPASTGSITLLERQKRRLAQKRERRVTLVLGIIMGSFLICWYPFFQLYVISALCGDACNISTLLFDVIFWIGYCNSALNPIIYTTFNKDFRRAFTRILSKLFGDVSFG
ncbi:Alpha-2 adrenergic receptor [Holothuria leucospilota]|uniref:Alpha-2 adrenergic receptor n=1 Tax=Holothuria leucospilota TaxID=206669 RepID=A0A9Q1BH98_HOLLE|nr:Alpha-2 adrenergic receptor [Holothuria leucospilota]